jgi:hypothetical protein
VTGKLIASVKTIEIYKGSISFIILQLIMVVAVIAFPVLVTGGMEKEATLSSDQIMLQLDIQTGDDAQTKPADGSNQTDGLPVPPSDATKEDDDPMKALLEATSKDAKK